MKLSFQCLAVTHTSGRVTLTPLELPELAVHAASLEDARFELTLALDDRISRSHPRHLWRYARPGGGELEQLTPVLLPVHRGQASQKEPLSLRSLQSRGQAGFAEYRLPSVPARYWTKGKEAKAEAQALLAEGLRDVSAAELLAMRAEGEASLLELTLEVQPLRLSQLRRKELHLEEREPPKPPEDEGAAREPEPDSEDDDTEQPPPEAPEDDWDVRPRSSPRKPTKVATPTLTRLGAKWHQLAREGAFTEAFCRGALVQQVRSHLESKDSEPLVLVGPSGVGKTAILQDVARALSAGPEAEVRPFFYLDASRLIAGTGMFGDWQRQTLDAFAEARSAKVFLHLGRLVDLLDAGKSAHSDDNVAQLLLPTLAAREVAVVTEATPEEWARTQARHHSFARLFTPLVIEEPAPAQLSQTLQAVAAREEKEHGVRVRPDALDEVRSLVRRFRPYGSTLGSCVTFLRRLSANAAHRAQDEVARADVIQQFSVESGVPQELLRDEVPLDVAQVEAFLAARVMGQPEAVRRVARTVTLLKANLADPRRPVGTLLFVGPTGVGKTELSKALAERVFGSRDRLLRFDMGEYSGPDALARLMGDAASEGQLTAAVRRQPFCVVLLDELEKAHPAVFDVLLGVLGEGRLTDARGRMADFRSALIVMTSNLGADTLRAQVGFSEEDRAAQAAQAHYLSEVRRFFRPELFNRLDEVVVFNALGKDALGEIVHREVAAVAARSGLARLDVALDTDESLRAQLAAQGFDPRYGARPLKRVLERELVATVATYLAAHPHTGALRLEARQTPGAPLTLKAHPVARDEDGASRTAILEVYEQAADLRAEVTAWARCAPMQALAQDLSLFDRMSRAPSFWTDRTLAEEQARRATVARELIAAFAAVRAQAEAAEELVFDAYHARSLRSAQELVGELDATRRAVAPLTVTLFTSLMPRAHSATVLLIPSRGALPWVRYLAGTYERWLTAFALPYERAFLLPLTKEEREAAARKAQAGGDSKAVAAPFSAWRPKSGGNADGGVALRLRGGREMMMLFAEHGLHRFYTEAGTFDVRVRFEAPDRELPVDDALYASLPGAEIRRVWPTRKDPPTGMVLDRRTETEHAADAKGFDLEDLLTAYVRHRVLGAEDEWT